MRILRILIAILWCCVLSAQTPGASHTAATPFGALPSPGDEEARTPDPSHHVGVDAAFNSNDLFVGALFYYANPFGEGFSLIGSFAARPYGRKTLVPERPHVWFYLREERYMFLVGLDKQYALTEHFGVFGSALAGFAIRDYRGLERTSTEWMFPIVAGGLQWSIPSGMMFDGDIGVFRIGASYYDMNENTVRLYTSILIGI